MITSELASCTVHGSGWLPTQQNHSANAWMCTNFERLESSGAPPASELLHDSGLRCPLKSWGQALLLLASDRMWSPHREPVRFCRARLGPPGLRVPFALVHTATPGGKLVNRRDPSAVPQLHAGLQLTCAVCAEGLVLARAHPVLCTHRVLRCDKVILSYVCLLPALCREQSRGLSHESFVCTHSQRGRK